jgi:RNA recognition motif-containing protein
MNIYVGNLAENVTEEDLRTLFGAHGQVASASVIKDRYSGRPRGFGFVEMPNNAEAQAAMTSLNGKDLKGKPITANEARPRGETGRPRGGGPRDRGPRRF